MSTLPWRCVCAVHRSLTPPCVVVCMHPSADADRVVQLVQHFVPHAALEDNEGVGVGQGTLEWLYRGLQRSVRRHKSGAGASVRGCCAVLPCAMALVTHTVLVRATLVYASQAVGEGAMASVRASVLTLVRQAQAYKNQASLLERDLATARVDVSSLTEQLQSAQTALKESQAVRVAPVLRILLLLVVLSGCVHVCWCSWRRSSKSGCTHCSGIQWPVCRAPNSKKLATWRRRRTKKPRSAAVLLYVCIMWCFVEVVHRVTSVTSVWVQAKANESLAAHHAKILQLQSQLAQAQREASEAQDTAAKTAVRARARAAEVARLRQYAAEIESALGNLQVSAKQQSTSASSDKAELQDAKAQVLALRSELRFVEARVRAACVVVCGCACVIRTL